MCAGNVDVVQFKEYRFRTPKPCLHTVSPAESVGVRCAQGLHALTLKHDTMVSHAPASDFTSLELLLIISVVK